MPQKSSSSRPKPPSLSAANGTAEGDDESISIGTSPKKAHESLRNTSENSSSCAQRDAMGYAIVTKGKPQTRPPPTGSDKPSAASGSVEYTDVCISDDSGDGPAMPPESGGGAGVSLPVFLPEGTPPEVAGEGRRLSSLRMLDYRIDSSQSSVTGSDEAYSVLNYRRAIQRAWKGLKRSAYSHVMVTSRHADVTKANGPKTAGRHERPAENDDVNVYDVARTRKPPRGVRCIDNDYDHAEPRTPNKRPRSQTQNARQTRILLAAQPNEGNESEV